MILKTHRLQNDVIDAGGTETAAPAAAPAPADGSAAPAAAPAPVAPAASPAAAADPAAAPATDAPAAAAKSALSAGTDDWTPAKVPEKFHVKGADGELDINATFRKVSEHRDNLEKRLGAGGVRPKTADEYKLPETFADMKLDEAGAKAWRAEAHEMGLSQAQYEKVMGKYLEIAPQLVSAGKEVTAEDTIASLTEVWKENTKPQISAAYGVAQRLASKTGVSMEEMEASIGNNPIAIRMLAALAPELREDSTPAAANGAIGGGKTIQELMAHPAYSNAGHPEHAAISKQVRDHYVKTTPEGE